jgi:monothiol glutaredoxin
MSENAIRDAIQEAIDEHEVILFMKGTPERPMCGFSARTVAALDAVGREFAAVDVLPDPRIRQELSSLSNWPTIPQLFVRGELVGGCDIVTEMYETGELAQVIGVQPPADAPEHAPAAAEPGAPPRAQLEVLSDRIGTGLLVASVFGILAAGLAARPVIVVETDQRERGAKALEDFVFAHGTDELRRNLEASDTARLADGYYRSCIPHDDRERWTCFFIDARKKPATLVRDPSQLPNKREP